MNLQDLPKQIILCADDFGQNAEVSSGILELLAQQRLSAVSCMTNGLAWKKFAHLLLPFKDQVDIGLHFNLTHGVENRSNKLLKLLADLISGKLNAHTVQASLEKQLEQFGSALGQQPDFIDGHQHIQQFPIIADAFVEAYNQLFKKARPYIRLTQTQRNRDIKSFILNTLARKILKPKLIKYNIPHNSSFAGVYRFSCAEAYRHYFPKFLAQVENNGIVMCHPGLASSDANDSIRESRKLEHAYFMSDEFIHHLETHAALLGRFTIQA